MKKYLPKIAIALLLLPAAASPEPATTQSTTEPASTQSGLSDLDLAAKPLIDFAAWCAANKAKSAGDAALVAAKKISAAPAGYDHAMMALRVAPDDANGMPEIAIAMEKAVEASSAALQKLMVDDPALTDEYLLKAIRISPRVKFEDVERALRRAIDANKWDEVADWYAILVLRDRKTATTLEPKLSERNLLPDAAKKAVLELLDNDQALAAISHVTYMVKADPRGFAGGKYQPCVDVLAAKSWLVRVPTHPMVAYVSIPWKWNPAKPSPVIFCFAGKDREHKVRADQYKAVVGEGPYVVVSPVTFSNTNGVSPELYRGWYSKEVVKPYASGALSMASIAQRLTFDQPGILAMFKAMQSAANLEQQMYITGFSGGGMPCYAMMLSSPELIAAAVPACSNYYLNIVPHSRAKNVPVQQYFGEKDGYNAAIGTGRGLIAQGREAAIVLQQMGYDVAEPVVVHNVGHDAMAKQAVMFFNSVRVKQLKPMP